jgi:hypothetical protein
MTIQGHPHQKVNEIQPTSQAWEHVPVIPAMWEAGLQSEAGHEQKHETLLEK